MEGEPYRPAKLFELQAILYKTDYFKRVVVKGLTGKATYHYIPVEVELAAPEHLNKYTFGAGYATDTGVRGKVDWSNRLFNTKGHKIKISTQLSELANTIALDYSIPRKDPRYDSFSHILSYQDRKWDDTNTQLFSAGINRVYKGPRFNYSTGLVIRDEVYDVGNTSGDSTLLIPSLNYGFVFADDIKKTQNGLKATLGILGGLEGVVSDASFLQFTFGSKMIVTPLDDWRLIGRGTLGGTLVDSINDLPPSLRFYAGGDNTIRGYKYKSIGSEDSSGTVIGGRYLVVGSIELERVIVHQWSVAAFWDVGSATDDLSLDFYQGAGIGVRFRLPFGQVKFDLASAISEDGQPFRVHLTVGGDL
jgi:translocation and assembly module TamA